MGFDFDIDEMTYVYSSAGFDLLYLLSEWFEPEMTTRFLTVAILLPSGVCEGDFSIIVLTVAILLVPLSFGPIH